MSIVSSRIWALKQTFRGIFHAKTQFMLAVTLAGLTLTIPVFLGILIWTFSEPLISVPMHTEITVFADRSAGKESVERLNERLLAIEEISQTQVVPKQEALAMMHDNLGLRPQQSKAQNPLPDIIIATVHPHTSDQEIASVAKQIEQLPNVDMVAYDDKWAGHVSALFSTASIILAILGSIIFALVGIVIAASVRLTTYAQRDEIAALYIFGASNAFICRPYTWRGCITLALSAGISLGLSYAGLRLLHDPLISFAQLYGVSVRLSMLSLDWCLLYVGLATILGGFIGAGTASSALRKIRQRTY